MESNHCILTDITDVNFTTFEFNSSIIDISLLFTWKVQCKLVFYALIITVGIIGNFGVVLTVILNRSMRTTINIYLVNLAIADLMICFCCMWVHFVNDFSEPFYVLGPFMCKFNSFTQMTSMTSSVLTLSTIALDRFVAIIFPFRSRITKQRTSMVILSIWLFSIAVALPFLFYKKHRTTQWLNVIQNTCDESWPPLIFYDNNLKRCIRSYPTKKLYYTFITVCLFFLPILIMLTAYALIVWKLWIRKTPGNRTLANVTVKHRAKKKVITLVCVVLFAFLICWAPLQVILLYSQFGHSSAIDGELPLWFHDITYFSYYIAYSNSAINPIIYGGFNNNFRQGLCNVLHFGCKPTFVRRLSSKKSLNTGTTALSCNQINGHRKSSARVNCVEMNCIAKQHVINLTLQQQF